MNVLNLFKACMCYGRFGFETRYRGQTGPWCAGVDGKRTEKARCGVVVAVCKCLVELNITHTLSAERSLHQGHEVKL